MSLERVIITGNIPRVTPGQFDVVDDFAMFRGVPHESVFHANQRRAKLWRIEPRLAQMQKFVIAVQARQVHDVMRLADSVIMLEGGKPSELADLDRVEQMAVDSEIDALRTTPANLLRAMGVVLQDHVS